MANGNAPSSLRLLILTPLSESPTEGVQASTSFPKFLERLTGIAPADDVHSFSGYTSHPALHIKTRYYETDVSIWCDELPLPDVQKDRQHEDFQQCTLSNQASIETITGLHAGQSIEEGDIVGDHDEEQTSTLSQWQTQMTSVPAQEVRTVIGGIILLLPLAGNVYSWTPQQISSRIADWIPFIEAISALRDAIEDDTGREVASLAILQGTSSTRSIIDSNTIEPDTIAPEDLRRAKTGADDKGVQKANELLDMLEDECLSAHGLLGWDFISTYDEVTNTGSLTNTTTGLVTNLPDGTTTTVSESLNEFGEKRGFPRVIQVLEGVNWSYKPTTSSPSSLSSSMGFEENDGFDIEHTDRKSDKDVQRELEELKTAILNPNSDNDDDNNEDDSNHEDVTKQEVKQRETLSDHADVWASLDTKNLNDEAKDPSASLSNASKSALPNKTPTTDKQRQSESQEEVVEDLQSLMDRILAIREAGKEMDNQEQRRRFAKREMKRLMKDL